MFKVDDDVYAIFYPYDKDHISIVKAKFVAYNYEDKEEFESGYSNMSSIMAYDQLYDIGTDMLFTNTEDALAASKSLLNEIVNTCLRSYQRLCELVYKIT